MGRVGVFFLLALTRRATKEAAEDLVEVIHQDTRKAASCAQKGCVDPVGQCRQCTVLVAID